MGRFRPKKDFMIRGIVMSKRKRKFADDGWAVWIDGEDISTIHINDWLNPNGKSYVDIAIHIRGIKVCKALNVYVPFLVLAEEIEDVSLSFGNTKILQAIFSAACIVDYKKNQHTSEIAYNGKTVDIVHISTMNFQAEPYQAEHGFVWICSNYNHIWITMKPISFGVCPINLWTPYSSLMLMWEMRWNGCGT